MPRTPAERASGHARGGALLPPRTVTATWRERRPPALWRRGGVQLDRLAASARARLDGELSGAGLEDQRRDLLGAVDADPGAEQPAARAVATRLVRCQSEALAHHASTLAAAQRTVNRSCGTTSGRHKSIQHTSRTFRCDGEPHRDAGQMRHVTLDIGELLCLIDVGKIESGPLWRGRRRVRSTSRCRITLR